jgi:RPA family protein
MQKIELPRGNVILATSECSQIASVSLVDGGFWVSLGNHCSNSHIILDHVDWNQFVDLVNKVDVYIKENYNG